jgi:rhamnogalacturonan acetylesterase
MVLTIQLAAILAAAGSVCAAPTVFLAGDSTMTAKGNNDGTAGWGVYLNQYINLTVTNNAIAGRSARSFTREGRFDAMAPNVKAGDYVIIEFGHNDGGSLTPTDNGRTDCNPVDNNYATTCKTTYK